MATTLHPVTLTLTQMTATYNAGAASVERTRKVLQDVADKAQDLGSMGEWVEAKIQQVRFNRHVLSQAEYSKANNVEQEQLTNQLDDLRTMAHMLKFAAVAHMPGTKMAHEAWVARQVEA